MQEGIEKIYSYRNNFLVIGLTGRTGSGCTTAASILSKEKSKLGFPKINAFKFDHPNEQRKTRIILDFSENNWYPFYLIRIKDIITSFILNHTFGEFCSYLDDKFPTTTNYQKKLKSLEIEYNGYHQAISLLRTPEKDDNEKNERIKTAFKLYTSDLHDFTEKLKSKLSEHDSGNLYTSIYQMVGDNIRSCGMAINESGDFEAKHTDTIIHKTNKIIKVIREVAKQKNKPAFIVIDALRNPFEVFYLKERYSSFYLMAINTENSTRLKRLNSLNFNLTEINQLDDKEYPKKLSGNNLYISQNIQRCTELADIHVNNSDSKDNNYNNLKRQLLWYYALMLKPGIINPTPDERIMQLAFTAKLNSGCISRQVGAAITDGNYSVKAIGWNNTPENQVPCLLRNSNDLIYGNDQDAYTEYERTDSDFRDYFKKSYQSKELERFSACGNNISFCFKEVQNNFEGDKNQVHTRSLHAEENAFLQLTKYGGQGITGGMLFTSASPCELCSKKAYQLGIQKIIYIDPYPGIAQRQILKGGSQNPELILFNGVIGKAYFQLYQPLLSYKDEIKQSTGLKFISNNQVDKLWEENSRLKKELETYKSKENNKM
ncbi:MAG: hypothetical protein KI791_19140 [Cyclobacteriaceae bacterium]|nr:hypothetical protein [Cyclobacteriaceae bacterium SS2]